MSYPAEYLDDDLGGLLGGPQRRNSSGFAALGELLGGGIDREGAFMRGQLQTARTQDAIERARLARTQAGIAAVEQDALDRLAAERPDVYATGYNPIDLILAKRGADYAAATQGRLRTQEYGNRATLADELAPAPKRQAAGDAVQGDFKAFEPVGSDAYYNTTDIAAGVQPVPAPPGSRAAQQKLPTGFIQDPADPKRLAPWPGGPADPATIRRLPEYKYINGEYVPIPGGKADPAGPNAVRASQQLRKEFESLGSVKDYKTILPLIESAKSAPDSGFGDLQLIYTAGKVLDPGSVVREGELALTIASGSYLQRVLGFTRFAAEQGGRLTPKSRAQLLDMLEQRAVAQQEAYLQDFNRFADYAKQSGYDPKLVVGAQADAAFSPRPPGAAPPQRKPAPAAATPATPPPAATQQPLVNTKGWRLHTDAQGNKAYVSPDGSQYEEVP